MRSNIDSEQEIYSALRRGLWVLSKKTPGDEKEILFFLSKKDAVAHISRERVHPTWYRLEKLVASSKNYEIICETDCFDNDKPTSFKVRNIASP